MRTLRQTLDREGLTHEEAAHALGVSKPTIYRWLDENPIGLSGKACLWCAGFMKVEWPVPFKPVLELSIPPEATDAALERRLELANRLLRTAVRAFTDVNDLRVMLGREEYPYEEEVHGPEESQGDDWKFSDAEKSTDPNLTAASMGVNDSDMNALAHPAGERPKTTSFAWYSTDRAIAEKLARQLGSSPSAVLRLALRRLGQEMLKEE